MPKKFAPQTLREILVDIGVDEFVSSIFGRRPLKLAWQPPSRGVNSTLDGFEHMLWSNEHCLSKHLLVGNSSGSTEVPRRRKSKDLFRWAIDHYLAGFTLRLVDTQEIESAAAVLARDTAQALLAEVSVEVLVLPQQGEYFRSADGKTEDVIVMQGEGQTHYEFSSAGDAQLIDNGMMGFGEGIYIPNLSSLTLKAKVSPAVVFLVRIHPLGGSAILDCLIEAASESDVDLRRTLPFGDDALPAYRSAALTLCSLATDAQVVDSAWAKLRLRIADSYRPAVGGHFAAASVRTTLTSRTPVQIRPGAVYAFHKVGDGLYLYVPGLGSVGVEESQPSGMLFPLSAEPLLRWISARQEAFCADDLPEQFSSRARLATVRRLLVEGALEAAPYTADVEVGQ